MGQLSDDRQLRERAFASVRAEVESFGSGHPDSALIRREGLLAAVTPAAPERSVFNSVLYEDPAALTGELDALAEAYEARGIRAWTVWVPDRDRETARLLAERGHLLDAAPRAMAARLADLGPEPAAPQGIEPGPGGVAVATALNDRAYGYATPAFAAAVTGETALDWHLAYAGETPVASVGTIAFGDDCCVTGVATHPDHQGRGIATWLMLRALAEARQGGAQTASLRATRPGAPVYARLGFLDLGFVEMWELRR